MQADGVGDRRQTVAFRRPAQKFAQQPFLAAGAAPPQTQAAVDQGRQDQRPGQGRAQWARLGSGGGRRGPPAQLIPHALYRFPLPAKVVGDDRLGPEVVDAVGQASGQAGPSRAGAEKVAGGVGGQAGGIEPLPAAVLVQHLDPDVGGSLRHRIVAAEGIVLAAVIAPHQPRRNPGKARQLGEGRGEVFAIAALLLEEKGIDRILSFGQIAGRVLEILPQKKAFKGGDPSGDIPTLSGDLFGNGSDPWRNQCRWAQVEVAVDPPPLHQHPVGNGRLSVADLPVAGAMGRVHPLPQLPGTHLRKRQGQVEGRQIAPLTGGGEELQFHLPVANHLGDGAGGGRFPHPGLPVQGVENDGPPVALRHRQLRSGDAKGDVAGG